MKKLFLISMFMLLGAFMFAQDSGVHYVMDSTSNQTYNVTDLGNGTFEITSQYSVLGGKTVTESYTLTAEQIVVQQAQDTLSLTSAIEFSTARAAELEAIIEESSEELKLVQKRAKRMDQLKKKILQNWVGG